MASSQILTPTCFSRTENLKAPAGIINDLSNLKFDGDGGTTIPEHIVRVFKFCTKHNIHCEDTACRLFILTFKAHVKEWYHPLPITSIHSFEHLVKELYRTFGMYDYKSIFKKIMRLRKSPDESLDDFHDHFNNFCFEFSENDINWNLMKEKFEFLVHILMTPQEYQSFESLPTYLSFRARKSATNEFVVTGVSSSSPLVTTPFPQVEVGELESSSWSNKPTISFMMTMCGSLSLNKNL